jgi:FMN-dependent NADH-azoreductase
MQTRPPRQRRTLRRPLTSGNSLQAQEIVDFAGALPRHGWDHRVPWLRHIFHTLGLTDIEVIATELTQARESPFMIELDLGAEEDASFAAAAASIDAAFMAST